MSTSTSVTHPDGTVVCVTTTATVAPPKSLKLMYFDGRGLMELPRQLLATAGLFAKDGDFEDFRYPISMEDGKFVTTEFGAAQTAGEHGSWNMSRVPLCIADGVEIGQGKAIARFVAKSYGLMGATPGQEGQIDTLCEHAAEMADAFKKLSTDEEKAKWFTTPAEPAAADKSNRQLLWFLGHIEACVGADGFSVGGQPSLADATLYSKLGETAPEAGDRGKIMGNTEAAQTAVAKFPKISKIVATFAGSEGMKKYLASRGPQTF